MVGHDLGARLVWIPSGTLKTTFPAAGSCLSRDILKYLVAGNSKSAEGERLHFLRCDLLVAAFQMEQIKIKFVGF